MPKKKSHQDRVMDLARQLVGIVADQETHAIGLEALLKAYVAVAIEHPCCSRVSSLNATLAANIIEKHTTPGVAPHIH